MRFHTRYVFEDPVHPCWGKSYRLWSAGPSGQVKNQQEGVFDGLQIFVREMTDALSQRTRVDGSDHLAENLGRLIENGDLRVEACGESGARSRADNDGRERKEIVRLDDHRVATAVLNMAASCWKVDLVQITANHAASPSTRPRPVLPAHSACLA